MSHLFKGPVTIFKRFGSKNTVKTEHNLKNISKYYKNILTNIFFQKP